MKRFLNHLFEWNHELKKGHNPNTGFVVGFTEKHMNTLQYRVCNVLEELGRPYRVANAADKGFPGMVEDLTGTKYHTANTAYDALRDLLCNTSEVIVIREFSASKVKRPAGYLHDFVKILDDAHLFDIRPKSDLILIDYGAFLQRAWKDIGRYLAVHTFLENG